MTWIIFCTAVTAAIFIRQIIGPNKQLLRRCGIREWSRCNLTLSLADGHLYALTPMGEFTLQRLQLNRPQLMALRVRLHAEVEKKRREKQIRDFLNLLVQFHQQQCAMHEAQGAMLREKADLLKRLLQEFSDTPNEWRLNEGTL